ncbi:MAG: hypothetical protein V3S46_05090, partial [Nitrospinota bacterium]
MFFTLNSFYPRRCFLFTLFKRKFSPLSGNQGKKEVILGGYGKELQSVGFRGARKDWDVKGRLPNEPLEFIRRCVAERKILWTYHVNMRMKDRFISREMLIESAQS